ncbi:class I adenylate-forming enzyme family protein [Nocardia nova]|uniref:class I adenylate-forming enzyme family protein n=1 Tax=Nocardia nova TaxID=37330 RepID=UPI001893EA07|nr:AMP-binding protein [Nocardia nova]MBF6149484.1 AMP-binding protein [Nocardia nova]
MEGPFDVSRMNRGPDDLMHYEDLGSSLVEVLQRAVRERPDRDAVVEVGGERLRYSELWDRAGRVAGGLRERGVQCGDRVAINLPNGAAWVVAYLGVILAGAIVVPVNTRFSKSEIEYVVSDSGAALLIDDASDLPLGPHKVTPADSSTTAAIFYTSGTTGRPKGAMLTHEAVLTNSENTRRFMAADMADEELTDLRTLIAVPLFHATGCHMQLVTSMFLRGTAVIMSRFDPARFLATVERERINTTVSAPAIYAMVMDHPDFERTDLSSLRSLYYGGAPTTPAQVRRMKKMFPAVRVGNGFGLTEVTGVLTLLPHDEAEDYTESVGYAMPCNELRIDRSDDDSNSGELLARGPNVMVGYWNNPQATAATIVDGWLRTGDIATIDKAGRVYIVDRAKDMINRGGENVYSSEVENALAAVEGVAEVAVVGVPDPTFGERVGALIVGREGVTLDPGRIVTEVQLNLADFKVPEYIIVHDRPLPRNAAGKVLKRQVRELDWSDVPRIRRTRAK